MTSTRLAGEISTASASTPGTKAMLLAVASLPCAEWSATSPSSGKQAISDGTTGHVTSDGVGSLRGSNATLPQLHTSSKLTHCTRPIIHGTCHDQTEVEGGRWAWYLRRGELAGMSHRAR